MEGIQFIATTPEQLRQDIKEDVKSQLDDLKSNFQPRQPEELLTRKEVAELFKINLSTLHHWTKKSKLKAYGISGRIYYKRSEIESSLIKIENNEG